MVLRELDWIQYRSLIPAVGLNWFEVSLNRAQSRHANANGIVRIEESLIGTLRMTLQSEIEDCLTRGFEDAKIEVGVQGNHANVVVESVRFEGLRPVERQRLVYGCLNELIRDGSLHAVTIVANVPETR